MSGSNREDCFSKHTTSGWNFTVSSGSCPNTFPLPPLILLALKMRSQGKPIRLRCRKMTWFSQCKKFTMLCCLNPKGEGPEMIYTKFHFLPAHKHPIRAANKLLNRAFSQPLPCFGTLKRLPGASSGRMWNFIFQLTSVQSTCTRTRTTSSENKEAAD